ncbi:hypothetical protein L0337_01855 [candidate division KSB1 bacterium]|nr:hypothetical protein [candidate division KSB1 bacterium]
MKMTMMAMALPVMAGLFSSELLAQRTNQDTSSLFVGSLIRASVFDVPDYKFVGTFTALRPDTLWLQPMNSPALIPISLGSLTRLDVSYGKIPVVERSLKGFGIGFVLGFGLGAVFSNIFKKTCENEFFLENETPCQDKVNYRQVALRFGIPVGLAGSLFWTLKKAERWEKVPIERIRLK